MEQPGTDQRDAVGYDLRITERCLVEDFGASLEDVPSSLEELEVVFAAHSGLIRAFRQERGSAPSGSDRMDGLASGRVPIHILRHGVRQRGLTWHDREARVVWLIAAHFSHRSGDGSYSDGFFRNLTVDQLRPTARDYERIAMERARTPVNAIFEEIPRLLKEAAAHRTQEIRGAVGPIPIRLLMDSGASPPHVHLGVGLWRIESPIEPPPLAILAIVVRVYGYPFVWDDLPTADFFPGPDWGSEWAFEWYISDWPEP